MDKTSYEDVLRDDIRSANRVGMSIGWRVLIWVIIGIIAATFIGWGIWALTVATSGVRGAGDGVIQKNSAENWLDAQARFVENYQEIIATDDKIELAYADTLTFPDDKTIRQTYTGLVSYCLSVVADYNADAQNFLRQDFINSELPQEISTTDPATDCKE